MFSWVSKMFTTERVDTLIDGLNVVMRITEVADAASDIDQTVADENMDQTHKVHRVATNIIYIVTSTYDAALKIDKHCVEHSPEELKKLEVKENKLRIAINGASFAREVSRKISDDKPFCILGEDGYSLLVIGLLKFSDSLNIAVKQEFVKINDDQEKSEKISQVLVLTAQIIYHHHTGRISELGRIIRSLFNSKNIENDDADEDDLKAKMSSEEDEKTGQTYVDDVKEVISAKSIDDFKRIPEKMKFDSVLNCYICQITKNPIRFILVVKSSRDEVNPIYYEKEEIEKLISENSPPSSWPNEVAFSKDQLIEPVELQRIINRRLEKLRVEICEAMEKMEEKANEQSRAHG